MAVKTGKVAGRRTLHFDSIEDIVRDAEQIVGQPHRTLGNWSAAQIIEHIAKTMTGAVDGVQGRPPFYIRWFAPLMKNGVLNKPMSPGFTLPKQLHADFMPANDAEEQKALENLRSAFERYKAAASLKPNVIFGRFTREEWDKLQKRHSEMHLSFIVPAE
jgi:hypothetical protein